MLKRWAAAGLLVLAPGAAHGHQASSRPVPNETVSAELKPEEVLVTGVRLKRNPRIILRAGGTPIDGDRNSVVANRIKLEFASRMAACAGRGRFTSRALMREVVDGAVLSPSQIAAQARMIKGNVTCIENTLRGWGGDDTDLGQSVVDRGALMMDMIKRYGGVVPLTRRETGDPAIQARFDAREIPRNRFRRKPDYNFFWTAVCLVRLQPALARELAISDGDYRQIALIETALIEGGGNCVAKQRRLYFEPTQFRLYIADAVYRWMVAVKGTDSLVPLET